MLELNPTNLGLMLLASASAGLVDAIVGGGGLIMVPSLFGLFPQAVPATLLGTNKAASVWGTGWSAWQYAQRVRLPSARLWGAMAAALGGALLGAWLATRVPAAQFRLALPGVLVGVWAYTLWRKDMGHTHAPHLSPRAEALTATGLGGLIGFYDGVFGPGTGSLLAFIFVRFFAYDFLTATASAKVINLTTNLAALSFFVPNGHIVWAWALPLALANLSGGLVGAHLAMRGGSKFLRYGFMALLCIMIGKFGWDLLH